LVQTEAHPTQTQPQLKAQSTPIQRERPSEKPIERRENELRALLSQLEEERLREWNEYGREKIEELKKRGFTEEQIKEFEDYLKKQGEFLLSWFEVLEKIISV
jgi:hypothetical protein